MIISMGKWCQLNANVYFCGKVMAVKVKRQCLFLWEGGAKRQCLFLWEICSLFFPHYYYYYYYYYYYHYHSYHYCT